MSGKIQVARIGKYILNAFIGIYAIATLFFSWLLYFGTPDNTIFAFIRSAYLVVLSLTMAICLILFLFTRNRTLFLLLLPNIAIVLTYLTPHLLPSFVTLEEDDSPIRIMTYNVFKLEDEQILDTYAELIRDANPDIIAFQDFSRIVHEGLRERIGDEYPYFEAEIRTGQWQSSQGVYSKFPILEAVAWVDEDLITTHPHQRLLLDIDDIEVVFYNIHPYPPIEWAGELEFIVYEADINAHAIAMQRIINRIQLETLPVLVAGDMNMSDQSLEYDRLSALLIDSFKSGGSGLGFTYPANNEFPELIRLDYIFHSDDFQTLTARVLEDSGTSDHLPLLADIVVQSH